MEAVGCSRVDLVGHGDGVCVDCGRWATSRPAAVSSGGLSAPCDVGAGVVPVVTNIVVHSNRPVNFVTEEAKVFWNKSAPRPKSAPGTLLDSGCELFDVIEDLTFVSHLAENFTLGVHHGRVIAAEGLADFR